MVESRIISVDSSFSAIDRLSKFIDPIVDHCPSATNVFAWSVDGCHSNTRTPASRRVPYHPRPALRTMVDVGSRTRRQDTHIHPAFRCGGQQVDEAALRGEVPVGDVQRLSGASNGQGEESFRCSASESGSRVQANPAAATPFSCGDSVACPGTPARLPQSVFRLLTHRARGEPLCRV